MFPPKDGDERLSYISRVNTIHTHMSQPHDRVDPIKNEASKRAKEEEENRREEEVLREQTRWAIAKR